MILEITAEERNVLEQVYGKNIFNINNRQVSKVCELTEEERRFFEHKNFVSPHFCVQTLYKVQGKLLTTSFYRAAKSLIEKEENFRANFCNVGTRTLKVVFENREIASEIVFRVLKLDSDELDETLIKIMEADRRLDFDIKRGSLIRFSVFRTGENEAAILVTISQLIAQNFNAESFFQAVFYNGDYKKITPRAVLKVPQLEDRVKEYWARLLKNVPAPPKIPFSKKVSGAYTAENYRKKITADVLSDLRLKTQSNRMMLLAALQTAWGFLLQTVNQINDAAFCQLTSNRKYEQNFSLNLMPVRLKSSTNMTLENIVNQQFKQLVVSQPYSFFDWAAIEDISLRRGNLFNHFLSFLDFNAEEKTYSQVAATKEGKIVSRNSWDAQGMKLGVYFQYNAQDLSISFRYDKNQFFQNAGERLANIYSLILTQMLVYWHAPFADFVDNIKVLAANISLEDETTPEDKRQTMIDFLHKNKILQTETTGALAILIENSKLITLFEGDRISGDVLDKNLVFAVEGKLARSLDTGDGWFNALDIIKAGGLINETVFIEKRRTKISAEVLTEKAVLLVIPLGSFESATRQNPALYKSILRHIASQMEKYQILWLQS